MNPNSTQERDEGGIDSIITSTLQKHYKGLIFQEEHKEGLLQEKTHMSKIKSSSNTFDNFSMKKVASFPAILHTMLEDKHDSSISWLVDDSEELEESTSSDNAKLWRIVSITELEKILPLYFNHGKYNSFLRQIYRWGFKRYGSTRDCYYHEVGSYFDKEVIPIKSLFHYRVITVSKNVPKFVERIDGHRRFSFCFPKIPICLYCSCLLRLEIRFYSIFANRWHYD